MESKDILKRIERLLERPFNLKDSLPAAAEYSQGCIGLLSLVYGKVTVEQFKTSIDGIPKSLERGSIAANGMCVAFAKGALQNLKDEIEAGLTGSLRHQVTGEVLTDFIQLARAALDEPGDGAKNVAAVLAATAFEDTLRRMGQTLAGIVGKEDLPNVLTALDCGHYSRSTSRDSTELLHVPQ